MRLRWQPQLGPVEIGDHLGLSSSTVHTVLTRYRLYRLTHIDRPPVIRSAATCTLAPAT